jgi:hypothetical protein
MTKSKLFPPDLFQASYGRGIEAHDRGDYATAYREFKALAEQGVIVAQFAIGSMYYRGDGMPSRDFKEAARWFRKAARQGHSFSSHMLGLMYFSGQCVPQNRAEAKKWYRKAAEQRDAEAQHEAQKGLYEIEQGEPLGE